MTTRRGGRERLSRTYTPASRPRDRTPTTTARARGRETFSLRSRAFVEPILTRAALRRSARPPALGHRGLREVGVHHADELHPDALGARGFALAMVGAGAEALRVHLRDHLQGAFAAFGLALGEEREVRDLGRGEEHRRSIRAGGYAGAAADA